MEKFIQYIEIFPELWKNEYLQRNYSNDYIQFIGNKDYMSAIYYMWRGFTNKNIKPFWITLELKLKVWKI